MDTQKLLFSCFLFLLFKICIANEYSCAPSSCGNIHNISYPFRLKTDPQGCGIDTYELSCENNSTVLYFNDQVTKLNVKAINYDNYTIRVADPGIDEDDCSSLPRFVISHFERRSYANGFLNRENGYGRTITETISFIKCLNPVNSSSYLEIMNPCINGLLNSSNSKSTIMYNYVLRGLFNAYDDLRENCSIEMTSMLPTNGSYADSMEKFVEIHREMAFGFQLTWYNFYCDRLNCSQGCYLDTSQANKIRCVKSSKVGFHKSVVFSFRDFRRNIKILFGSHFNIPEAFEGIRLAFRRNNYNPIYRIIYTSNLLGVFLLIRNLCVAPFLITFIFYKWKRRHLSDYNKIEEFLQSQNNLMPGRYTFSDIKKMTRGFKEKLGKGGFGTVYKGKLRSGQFAAIKILENSKTNGQDFINEVATIGKIHHANIVQLVGFCCERSKFALVYEFMPNGSLDKHIVSPKVESVTLSWEKLYEISVGVARGIEYLHHGCEMQILHFDIKPHNILLDENFAPKISDFGLAKLYPRKGDIGSVTAAKGTIGYMAPEFFYKNIGSVSYKADVYSFGMLLLEIAGRRKNLKSLLENSGQSYYSYWVNDELFDEKFVLGDAAEEENKIARKLIIIGLWCIQMQPSNRPAMNKVVEMLEGDLESLEVPPRPLQYKMEPIQTISTRSSRISYVSSSLTGR
ncbi:LEAF RUST 10 DISEASE-RESISTANCEUS RECEPTOR-LIKE PROTEIN KINASE-like 2.8 [Euphorbia lathyris]|uniref:LEAF RUST 10 DISEASE-RESISTANCEUS RECEPTOR-LIKE PROTEIN KINASE-like 2.8 n=1 Tax=Euphorbia lathyris TaxID=212925 RepID=UPI0033131909